MDAMAIVAGMAALGVVGLVLSILLVVLSVQRSVASLSGEHRTFVTAVAVAQIVGSVSDLAYAVAYAGDNFFDVVCRVGRYCSTFVVLSVSTTLLINSCGRLIELRKGTAGRRLGAFYCVASAAVAIVFFFILPDSQQSGECDLGDFTVAARAVYVLALGGITAILNCFIYRELQKLCANSAANVNNGPLALRVRQSRLIVVSTTLLTAYVVLMQVLLTLLSIFSHMDMPTLNLLNSLNSTAIGVLVLLALPQYRAPFSCTKDKQPLPPPAHTQTHLPEPSKMMTEAESVPRIVVIRSPKQPQRRYVPPLQLAHGQRKGTSPFPPSMRHLFDAPLSPSASFASTTTEITSSPPSAVWS